MRLWTFVIAFFLVLLPAFGWSDETDHAANDQTIKVTFGALTADPETPGRKVLSMTVRNEAAVSVILRGIATESGQGFKVKQGKTLFGKKVWSDAKFVQINPGKSLNLKTPKYKLIAPKGFGGSTSLRLDFGVKGVVWVPYK